jgi:hypothetical protein
MLSSHKMKKFYQATFLLFVPALVLAQQPTDVQDLIGITWTIVQTLTGLVVALSLLYFFWGLAQFILHTGGGKEQEEAKGKMFWGIIALFVMVSVWGLVRFLQNSFVGTDTSAIDVTNIITP